MQGRPVTKNASGQSLDQWVSTLPATDLRTVVFKAETRNAFYVGFLQDNRVIVQFDPFGCRSQGKDLREIRLRISSRDSLGGENEYRFHFSGGSALTSINLTMVESLDEVSRNRPEVAANAVAIPLAAIPFQRFDLRMNLIGPKRSSLKTHVDLKGFVMIGDQ
jgi:hypothetical protein